jgi:hypothetical protein
MGSPGTSTAAPQISGNWANGLQYYRNGLVYWGRGDLVNAQKNLADAFKAAGAKPMPYIPVLAAYIQKYADIYWSHLTSAQQIWLANQVSAQTPISQRAVQAG